MQVSQLSQESAPSVGLDVNNRRQEDQDDIMALPHPAHPGTPRLYTDGRFNTPDGRARLHATDYEPPPETPDDDYPLWLNTGRVQEHWHTRTKTGRVALLNDWIPEPYVEINPQDAERVGIQSGDRVTVESRRVQITLLAWVTAKVAPGAVFAMWHFGDQPANDLTLNAACPLSRQPGYKACAVRVVSAGQTTGRRSRP